MPEYNKSALQSQEGGDHYKSMKIQPTEYIYHNNIPFIEGCVIKYVSRWRNKGGIQDLKKSIHFLQMLIEFEESGNFEGISKLMAMIESQGHGIIEHAKLTIDNTPGDEGVNIKSVRKNCFSCKYDHLSLGCKPAIGQCINFNKWEPKNETNK